MLCFTGCREVLKVLYRVHKPRIEKTESVRNYYLKSGIDTMYLFHVKSKYWNKVLKEQSYMPSFQIYDKSLNLLNPGLDTIGKKGCPKTFSELIATLDANSTISLDSSRNNLTEILILLDGNTSSVYIDSISDYYIVAYSGKFCGKLNSAIVDVQNMIAKNSKAHFKFIKISLDPLKSWN